MIEFDKIGAVYLAKQPVDLVLCQENGFSHSGLHRPLR